MLHSVKNVACLTNCLINIFKHLQLFIHRKLPHWVNKAKIVTRGGRKTFIVFLSFTLFNKSGEGNIFGVQNKVTNVLHGVKYVLHGLTVPTSLQK